MSRYPIITLILTILCPPIGLVLALLGFAESRKNWKIYIFCVAWSMAVFAYCYVPTINSDIVGYLRFSERLAPLSLGDAMKYAYTSKDHMHLYAYIFIWWLAGKLGVPQILPAISVFTVYYISLYMTCTWAEDLETSKKERLKCILFTLATLSFYSLTNNIRNVFSFCLISYAVFREYYKNKKDIFTLLLYILPCFIHASSILLVLARIALSLAKKMKSVLLTLIIIVEPLLELLNDILENITFDNIVFNLIKNMVAKASRYFNLTNSSWAITAQNSGSIRLTKVLYIAIIVIFGITIIFFSKYEEQIKDNKKNINYQGWQKCVDFIFILVLLTLACGPMVMPEYWRFAACVIVMSGAVYLPTRLLRKNNIVNQFIAMIFILAIGCFALWGRDLLLYSDVPAMCFKSMICNPIGLAILKILGLSL